nr:phospholipase-like protein [Tanacetum cinerariifolium]
MVNYLDAWNSPPWGEHIWRQLYDSIRNVCSKHKLEHLDGLRKNPNHVPSYTLSGFLFAFKEYSAELFDKTPIELSPTKAERQSSWYNESNDFLCVWYQWGTSNLENNEATLSGSSFMNIDNDREFACNTPIGEKINKIECQIGEGKVRLLDNDENPLLPTDIVESDSEAEVLYDETANLMIPISGSDRSDKGYGINSLLEQWRDSYPENDEYDPYDDDMYENHDLSEQLQSMCDDLDITIRSRKKK